MRLEGRRVHIAGSAAPRTPREGLTYAHALVAALVSALVHEGATFIAQAGKEPRANDDESLPAIVFDWTTIETIADELRRGAAPYGAAGQVLAVVATLKTEQQIPADRRGLWDELVAMSAVRSEYIGGYWTSGAVRRERQAQLGDVLIAVSGGEGVQHLAQLYANQGKPVIPLDCDIGSSTEDRSGGARRLNEHALAHPEEFFRLGDPSIGATALASTTTRGGTAEVSRVVDAILRLLASLRDPEAFYIRLLDPLVADFSDVNTYFNSVVDPVVTSRGYSKVTMGETAAEEAFLNVEIFSRIHHAGMLVVDLTGTRPNCMMELGYGFGRTKRIVLTAREDTRLPFDPSAIDTHLWNTRDDDADRMRALNEYCARTALRPPIVKPRGWQP